MKEWSNFLKVSKLLTVQMKCQSKNSDDDQSYEQEDGGRCELCTFFKYYRRWGEDNARKIYANNPF